MARSGDRYREECIYSETYEGIVFVTLSLASLFHIRRSCTATSRLDMILEGWKIMDKCMSPEGYVVDDTNYGRRINNSLWTRAVDVGDDKWGSYWGSTANESSAV